MSMFMDNECKRCMALFFVALTKNVFCFSDAIGVELHPLLRQYQIVVPVGNEAPFFFWPIRGHGVSMPFL